MFVRKKEKDIKELNAVETYIIKACYEYLKNNNISYFCEKFIDEISSTAFFMRSKNTDICVKENVKFVDRNSINLNLTQNVYDYIKTIYERTDCNSYNSSSKTLLLLKHKDTFILTNNAFERTDKTVDATKLDKFDKLIKETTDSEKIWDVVDDTFAQYYEKNNGIYTTLSNILRIVDNTNVSMLEVKKIKAIVDEVHNNKNIVFLYIIDKNNISVNFKTLVKTSSSYACVVTANFNINVQNNAYAKNSLNYYVFGRIFNTARRYYRKNFDIFSVHNKYNFALACVMNLDNYDINYTSVVKNFNKFFMSSNMFDNSESNIDFVLVKSSTNSKLYDFDFYVLNREDYVPFKFSFYYKRNLRDYYLIKHVIYNDFNNDPKLSCSNKGAAYIYLHKTTKPCIFNVGYNIYEKNGKVYKKYFKSYDELPYFKHSEQGKKELAKIFVATEQFDESEYLEKIL